METHNRHFTTPFTASRYVDNDFNRMRSHEEAMLDEALAATFPCSDPVSSLSVDEPPRELEHVAEAGGSAREPSEFS